MNIDQYKNKYFLYLILFVLIGFLIRLLPLDKQGGLRFDEIYSYYMAKESFPFGILDKLYNENFYPPFYFYLLHFWIKVFGSSDYILRFLSLITGIAAIPLIYFLGKETEKNKKTAVIAAMLMSLNSAHILYSQDVTLYSLSILLATIVAIFVVRAYKSPSYINYFYLMVSNLALLYTLGISSIFYFWQVVIFCYFLYKNDKNQLWKYLFFQVLTILFFAPYVPFMNHFKEVVSSQFIESPTGILCYKYTLVAFLIKTFSPLYIGETQFTPEFIFESPAHILNFIFMIFLPVILCVYAMYKGLFGKNKNILILFLIFIFSFLTQYTLALLGIVPFVSRYGIHFLPIMVVVCAYGFSIINNKKLVNYSLFFLAAIYLSWQVIIPYSTSRMDRYDGYKVIADFLSKQDFNKGDALYLAEGGRFLEKYYDKTSLVPLDFWDIIVLNKRAEMEKFMDKKVIYKLNKNNAKKYLYDYFNTEYSPELEKTLNDSVYSKLGKNKHFIVVIFKDLSPFNENELKYIISNKDKYYSTEFPMFWLIFSKINSDIVKISSKYLKLIGRNSDFSFNYYIFEKQ